MAKAAILNVLEETIGRYVQGLDSKSLNVAVWAGKIELQGLKVDTRAVNRELARQAIDAPNLAVPFRIVDGSFESLKVEVPWARLTSRPVVICISGLNVKVEPYDHLSSTLNETVKESTKKSHGYTSDEMKDQKAKSERLSSLQHAEEARQRFNAMREITEMDEYELEDDKSSQTRDSASGFKARLVRRIIENIQVDIDDIQFTLKGHGCDAGIRLDRFSVFTTNKDGQKSFIDRATNSQNIMKSFLYKALELDGLAIFLNEETKAPILSKAVYKSLASSGEEHTSYILAPLSFRARLRQSDCLECIDFPKYLLVAHLPNVSLRLSRVQLEIFNELSNELKQMKHVTRPLFPEYRPDIPITKESTKEWWKYAVRSIGRINRRRSWTEFFIAYQKRKKYISLYKRMVYSSECSWLQPLFIHERADLDEIENDKTISMKGIMAWRNMADAQFGLEMKKFEQIELSRKKASPKKKSSFRSMIFGRKNTDDDEKLLLQDSFDKNEPPITLSDAEMRELDALALEAANTDLALSSESMLCDLSFEMGSFTVDLITFASAPLLSFEMGTVKTVLKAYVDGSFTSSFALSSLNVYDRITRKTLFPGIIRSLQTSSDSLLNSTFGNAIELKLTKERNGDQYFEAKIVSYEIIASDNALRELKKFFTISNVLNYTGSIQTPRNPLLQYSVTGGADLFYDAGDIGASLMHRPSLKYDVSQVTEPVFPNTISSTQKQTVSDKLSSAFADAWRNKLEKEVTWSIEIQLHAPIIVIPESSIDPDSVALVIDLGTLHLTYGKQLSPQVERWFRSHMSQDDIKADQCNINMEHFSFRISKAGKRDWVLLRESESDTLNESKVNSVIDPVTLSISIGIENWPLDRKCVFGMLERINLSLSHLQILQTMSVLSTWKSILSDLSYLDNDSGIQIISEKDAQESAKRNVTDVGQDIAKSHLDEKNTETVHISLGLQEFKVKIINSNEESMEANLVAVASAFSLYRDGSSFIRLNMGYFWIIDHLFSKFPRQQRFLAHSKLPESVFEPGFRYQPSEDSENFVSLADIKVSKVLGCVTGDSPFNLVGDDIFKTEIHAKFSTLFLYWNPYTIRDLLIFQRDLAAFSERLRMLKVSRSKSFEEEISKPTSSLLVIQAEMEAFDLSLNSALDDLLLFHMKMSRTHVTVYSSKGSKFLDDNLKASLLVGDFHLSVPSNDKIFPEYQVVLGLDDSHLSSVLQLEYGKGERAIELCPLPTVRKHVEMYMTISLSPMRFVYIQAQILTMAEYLTEGVLGAITEKIATSAAQAAAHLTEEKGDGEKFFLISAKGFNLLLPQAAYESNFFSLRISELNVNFTSLPEPGAGFAAIQFQHLTMSCSAGDRLIEDPITMEVQIVLAPLIAPTPHDMATRINIDISRISLILSRQHYRQAFKTLDLNIGELNSFLRESDFMSVDRNTNLRQRLTHGGVEEIVIQKRLYIKFHFEELCLELCNRSYTDPLVALTALKTDMDLKLLPDEEIMNFHATLQDLDIEDRRIDSIDRPFRMLMQQVNLLEKNDIFRLVYSNSKTDRMSSLTLQLGSPRLVLIPDALFDLESFFKTDCSSQDGGLKVASDAKVEVSTCNMESIDASASIQKFEFSLETEDCSFVFLDLQAAVENLQVNTEVLVLKGQLDLKAILETELRSGVCIDKNIQMHGENIQIVSANGSDLLSPLQILDPLKFSMFFRNHLRDNTNFVDFSVVTLTDVNACASIRQYALFIAILSAANELFGVQSQDNDIISLDRPLTKNETGKINELVTELEHRHQDVNASDIDVINYSQTLSTLSRSTVAPKPNAKNVLKMKFTVPKACLVAINDLQGADEALFRLMFSTVVNNTEACITSKSEETIFHSHTYWIIDSDYFDSQSKRWERLLTYPWELDFKAVRGKKKDTSRMATTIDIESHQCRMSFSEQFIINIKGAHEMWNSFKEMNHKADAIIKRFEEDVGLDSRELSMRKAMARSAIRSLTTVLPYGISNRSGLPVTFRVTMDSAMQVNEAISYFSFPRFKGEGIGVQRVYGQDSSQRKTIILMIADQEIRINHLDDEVGRGKRIHHLEGGCYIFTEVEETGKTTILHISSFMDILNYTCLDIPLALKVGHSVADLGLCQGLKTLSNDNYSPGSSKTIKPFGVSASVLQESYSHANSFLALAFSPVTNIQFYGELRLPSLQAFHQLGTNRQQKLVEVVCKNDQNIDAFTFRVECRVILVSNYPLVQLSLQPRMILSNETFVNITVRTPMTMTFSPYRKVVHSQSQTQEEHKLCPWDTLQVFHPGTSVAFSFRCTDNPIGGSRTGWNKFGWIDIPLTLDSSLVDKICSSFPFLDSTGKISQIGSGGDFFLLEDDSTRLGGVNTKARTIKISIYNLGVDHTGDVLFEGWNVSQKMTAPEGSSHNATLGSFASKYHKRRITILPSSDSLIRILHLSMDGKNPYKRSIPFSIDEIPFSDGGLESVPVSWDDGSESGYFAYRRLSTLNQSEIHIIPDYIIYNGGKDRVRVSIQQRYDFPLDSGTMAITKKVIQNQGLYISLKFEQYNIISSPVLVGELGLKLVLVKDIRTGTPVGNLPVQTVIGSRDSRFVVKLGQLKRIGLAVMDQTSLVKDDFLHFRIRWSQLEIDFADTSLPLDSSIGNGSYQSVTKFILDRFTLDYQRLYKDLADTDSMGISARTQFSAIIRDVKIMDCTTKPETLFLGSDSVQSNFIDLRIRTKGDGSGGLLKVDLIDVKLGHDGEKPHEIILNTNEAFLWSLLDIASRTKIAISAFASIETDVTWDCNSRSFLVTANEIELNSDDDLEIDGTYRAPSGDILLAVKRMYVWQSSFLLSFKRQPQTARYAKVKNVKGAKIVNYFTKKLNFTIDRARLKFASFSSNNVNGPPDRILQPVKAFYIAQLKKKMFTLLSATSIDEWKQLAGRDDGKDSYVEGDLLRMGGNLAGKSAGYLVKQVGRGLGTSLKVGTSELGKGIQNVTEVIGIGAVGSGLNSLVSGVGESVSSTVEGVGDGGSKIIKGAGKAVGQIAGGVGGGLLGITKGVATGDAKALADGVGSIGTGVLKGTESVVVGVGEGVFHVGKGLFNGIRRLGSGVGDAFTGSAPGSNRSSQHQGRDKNREYDA